MKTYTLHDLTHKNPDYQNARAVVLFSGGLDSTTCLYWAKSQFKEVIAISFRYGQRHSSELVASQNITQSLGIHHRIIDIDLKSLGGSALTDSDINVPNYQDHGANGSVPVTYVPARNTIFLSYALAVAEVMKANHIIIGVSSVDYSGYPDCRPDYIDAFEHMANLATVAGRQGQMLSIIAPLQTLSKAQTLQLGLSLGVDYAKTVSCYQADSAGHACGVCDSCVLRKEGFKQAGVTDPTRYVSPII